MARFALFTNGVKVETLDELKDNFNIKDMLENYRNKALHRWLMINRMAGELSQVEAITATEDNAVIDELVKIFGISAETIEEQKRVLEAETQKKEEVLSQLEKDLLTDIEKNDFLKYMDDSPDAQNIIALLQKHAGRGNAVAQLKLGYCFEYEKGVGKNSELAVEWYKKSAEQGLARAQNSLGYCFQNGIGIEKDPAQGFFWYQKSANQDFHDGLFNLGVCYEFGIGVDKNLSEAMRLYTTLAEQENMLAEYALGRCYDKGKNLDKAFFWYQKSANHGYAAAQFRTGLCYEHGLGVEEDFEQCKKWLSKAASQGFSKAQAELDGFKQISQTFDVFLNDFSSDTKISLIAAISQFLPSGSMEEAEKLIDSDHVAIAQGVDFEKMKLICSAIKKCGGKAGVIVNY